MSRLPALGASGTVREAMEVIDDGGMGIALVLDDERRLLGTVTDGDIRRALLGGASLESAVEPYMNRRFTAVTPDVSRAHVLDLMRARRIEQIPVVDAAGKLVGLHLMREMIGVVDRPNWAVIMAGGRGTRLRPITDSIPKPMVRVAGRPILEHIVLHLVGFGITKLFVAVHYKAEAIEEYFGDGHRLGCEICYLREEEPLGTGGALSILPGRPEHPVVVLNGDVLTQANVGELLSFHVAGSYTVTVGVHRYVHTVPYGVLEVEDRRVTGIREKPSHMWLVNAGIYVLDPVVLERIPRGGYYPLPALVEECLARGEGVGAYQIEEDWIDVGRPADLARARGERGGA